MPECGSSDYDMVKVGGISDISANIVLKARIDTINRAENTANLVYLTECPGASVPYNNVDFFYHCQYSDGNEEFLPFGNEAYEEDDEVYVLHLPHSGNIAERTYIIGHADIRSTKRCVSEYIVIYQEKFLTIFDVRARKILDPSTFKSLPGSPSPPSSFPVNRNDITFGTWFGYNFVEAPASTKQIPYFITPFSKTATGNPSDIITSNYTENAHTHGDYVPYTGVATKEMTAQFVMEDMVTSATDMVGTMDQDAEWNLFCDDGAHGANSMSSTWESSFSYKFYKGWTILDSITNEEIYIGASMYGTGNGDVANGYTGGTETSSSQSASHTYSLKFELGATVVASEKSISCSYSYDCSYPQGGGTTINITGTKNISQKAGYPQTFYPIFELNRIVGELGIYFLTGTLELGLSEESWTVLASRHTLYKNCSGDYFRLCEVNATDNFAGETQVVVPFPMASVTVFADIHDEDFTQPVSITKCLVNADTEASQNLADGFGKVIEETYDDAGYLKARENPTVRLYTRREL